MEHTKGEWKYFKSSNGQVSTFYCGNNTQIYDFEIKHNENTAIEAEANAKLIAAAPDLLSALIVCHEALSTYKSHPIIDKQVIKAIEKATQ